MVFPLNSRKEKYCILVIEKKLRLAREAGSETQDIVFVHVTRYSPCII